MSDLTIPDTHHDLVSASTVTLSTLNPDGSIQTTAIWVLLGPDGLLRTSLARSRQKYRNLAARPAATLFSILPANPFHTVEVRATTTFEEDRDRQFMAELLAPYGQDLTTFSTQAAEDRVVAIFTPRQGAGERLTRRRPADWLRRWRTVA